MRQIAFVFATVLVLTTGGVGQSRKRQSPKHQTPDYFWYSHREDLQREHAQPSGTTRPTWAIDVRIDQRIGEPQSRVIKIIVPLEVAERLKTNDAITAEDRQWIMRGIQIEIGDLGEPRPYECDRPPSRLINEGRFPANCSSPAEQTHAPKHIRQGKHEEFIAKFFLVSPRRTDRLNESAKRNAGVRTRTTGFEQGLEEIESRLHFPRSFLHLPSLQ